MRLDAPPSGAQEVLKLDACMGGGGALGPWLPPAKRDDASAIFGPLHTRVAWAGAGGKIVRVDAPLGGSTNFENLFIIMQILTNG